MLLKKDGHTHTPFSHQNSDEPFDAYIERAIALGFDAYDYGTCTVIARPDVTRRLSGG